MKEEGSLIIALRKEVLEQIIGINQYSRYKYINRNEKIYYGFVKKNKIVYSDLVETESDAAIKTKRFGDQGFIKEFMRRWIPLGCVIRKTVANEFATMNLERINDYVRENGKLIRALYDEKIFGKGLIRCSLIENIKNNSKYVPENYREVKKLSYELQGRLLNPGVSENNSLTGLYAS